ncbi:MAG: ATP-binding protein [Alphaproteobacteria bacterium]
MTEKTAVEAGVESRIVGRILEALADPAVLLDSARAVLAANSAAHDLLKPGALGRDLALSLRHPRVLEAADQALKSTAAVEIEVTLPDAVPCIYRVRAAPLAGVASEGAAVLLVLHDVTPSRNAERMRADFVANVSHELRSPLTSLLGFIETLRGPARGDDAARERFLKVMEGEAKRMTRLIQDLLSLSRVEADEHVPPRGEADVADVLREIADSVALRAAERGMTIELDCAEGLPPAHGDRDEITLVFRNLLDNAVNYGREDTTVAVTARPVARIPGGDGPGIAVAIHDRGEGIASEHIPRLTERFYRVDKGRSREMGGTGLGLAIVKHIVSHHRGVLAIDSTPGKGSVFTVFLPVAGRDAAASPP